ncbi:transposase [Endozoicomonas sp. Mp262]|uniref:transposase n=1 Tax=Endozoicomonas sp. Mp262 TaxID=2919499 RepID=UPI0021D923F9
MTRARRQLVDLGSTPYYHCMARCVRRAFLCGEDHLTGKSFEHRKAWVVDRLKVLAGVFTIEVCAYAVMSNHYHVVLFVNEAAGKALTTREVLERWTQLFAGPLLVQRYLARDKLSKAEYQRVEQFADDYRNRLLDISWFMRCLNEHLAREANLEDGCKGRFWEGRFKSQALLDEAAVLTCMAYVDLNPVRAGQAKMPESSDFSSIQDRIRQWQQNSGKKQCNHLKPLQWKGITADKSVPFSLLDYFYLIDWTGRSVRPDKKGVIPADLPPLLVRLGIDSQEWLKTMQPEGNRFQRAAGTIASLRQYSKQIGQRWVKGLVISKWIYSG